MASERGHGTETPAPGGNYADAVVEDTATTADASNSHDSQYDIGSIRMVDLQLIRTQVEMQRQMKLNRASMT